MEYIFKLGKCSMFIHIIIVWLGLPSFTLYLSKFWLILFNFIVSLVIIAVTLQKFSTKSIKLCDATLLANVPQLYKELKNTQLKLHRMHQSLVSTYIHCKTYLYNDRWVDVLEQLFDLFDHVHLWVLSNRAEYVLIIKTSTRIIIVFVILYRDILPKV